MDTDSNQTSREEKEALLNKRMEEMRLKNAALQKRHQEVLADKRNAEVTSNKFQESRQLNPPPTPPVSHIPAKSRVQTTQRISARARHNEIVAAQKVVSPESDGKRAQRLSEDDGPPPDPGYSFLSDRRREVSSQQQQQQHHQSTERNQGSRRHAGNYGGQDFENVKSSMQRRKAQERGDHRQGPQNKMEMAMRMTGRERREYEQWKNERSRIEEDRVNRHKTSSGEWRREWDRDKNSTDEEPEPPQRDSRRGGGGFSSSSRVDRGKRSRGSQPRYTSEYDHQRLAHGDFVQCGTDFPSLPDEQSHDSSAILADSRKVEINSNTMKISFSATDRNDNNAGSGDRDTQESRWRSSEGRQASNSSRRSDYNAPRRSTNNTAQNSANTTRHSGRGQSKGAVGHSSWRPPPRQDPRDQEVHTAPNNDWHDKQRDGNRHNVVESETPSSLFGDLREVLARTAASRHSKLPPLLPEPIDQISGDEVAGEPWEDDGSWEDAVSPHGLSSDQSQEADSDGLTCLAPPPSLGVATDELPSLAPPPNFDTASDELPSLASPQPYVAQQSANQQSLGDGMRELYLKQSELLMTNMNIIDISLAANLLGARELEPISLAPRELAPISLAPRELAPISLAPRELEPNSLTPCEMEPISLSPRELEPISVKPRELEPMSLVAPFELEQISPIHPEVESICLAPPELEPVTLAPCSISREITPVPDNSIERESIVSVQRLDDGTIGVCHSPPDSGDQAESESYDQDEIYYSDQHDAQSETEDVTIEDDDYDNVDDKHQRSLIVQPHITDSTNPKLQELSEETTRYPTKESSAIQLETPENVVTEDVDSAIVQTTEDPLDSVSPENENTNSNLSNQANASSTITSVEDANTSESLHVQTVSAGDAEPQLPSVVLSSQDAPENECHVENESLFRPVSSEVVAICVAERVETPVVSEDQDKSGYELELSSSHNSSFFNDPDCDVKDEGESRDSSDQSIALSVEGDPDSLANSVVINEKLNDTVEREREKLDENLPNRIEQGQSEISTTMLANSDQVAISAIQTPPDISESSNSDNCAGDVIQSNEAPSKLMVESEVELPKAATVMVNAEPLVTSDSK